MIDLRLPLAPRVAAPPGPDGPKALAEDTALGSAPVPSALDVPIVDVVRDWTTAAWPAVRGWGMTAATWALNALAALLRGGVGWAGLALLAVGAWYFASLVGTLIQVAAFAAIAVAYWRSRR